MMKSKLKGLFTGFIAGILMSATVAFADGGQMANVVNKITIMLDGVEKTPAEGQVFVKDNYTYVPIRFAAELLGKPIKWDSKTNTIWIGNLGDKEVVADYKDGSQLLAKEFNTYLSIMVFFNPSYKQYAKDANYLQYMLNQYSALKLLSKSATLDELEDAMNRATAELDTIKKSNTAMSDTLTSLQLTETDIFQYLQTYFGAMNVLASRITDDQIKAEYDKNLQADPNAYTYATVRHILIALKDSAGKDLRTRDEALARAQEVEGKLAAGGDFAELVKAYSDDPGSKDTGGEYVNQLVNQWVPPFKKAVLELELNTISDPVESDFGFHIIEVESRSAKTLEEMSSNLRQYLASGGLSTYITNELPGQIVSMHLPQ